MRPFLQKLVQDYGWVHLGIGLAGNCLFLFGSILFLPDWGTTQVPLRAVDVEWKTVGVWFFIAGAALMLLGSFGQLLVSIYSDRKKRRQQARTSG